MDAIIHQPATLSAPHEWDETLHYLRVDLLSVWIFDRKSGRVLFKIDGKDF